MGRPAQRYAASLDRAGYALAAGGLVGGLVAGVIVAIGGEAALLGIAVGFVIGTIVSTVAAVAIGGPLWIVCHALGMRGPVAAASVGALGGFALFLGGQTYGYGAFAMPATDARALLFRWISAVAISLILAVVSGAIGWTMWRVAYRRI